jgi:hypothetical protein
MNRIRAHILREAAAAGSYKAARDKGRLIGVAWLRRMDLRVIEVRPMRLLESRRDVIRLWCTARNGDEFCVYAEPYTEGNGPKSPNCTTRFGGMAPRSGLVATIAKSARSDIRLLRTLRPIERSARTRTER